MQEPVQSGDGPIQVLEDNLVLFEMLARIP